MNFINLVILVGHIRYPITVFVDVTKAVALCEVLVLR